MKDPKGTIILTTTHMFGPLGHLAKDFSNTWLGPDTCERKDGRQAFKGHLLKRSIYMVYNLYKMPVAIMNQ